MARGPKAFVRFGIAAACVTARSALAQPDLPPPPPPPLGQSPQDAPPLPSPDAAHPVPPHHGGVVPAPPAPAPASRHAHGHHHAEALPDVPPPPEPPPARSLALLLNPLGLPWGRLSADVDVMPWGPHHALVLSANALVAQAERGGSGSLLSEGFGFVSRGSSSVGLEAGYHYGPWRERSIRGPFFGPSFLLGSTTQATVGDPSHAQAYWGVAFDAGMLEVLASGLTVGGGLGIGILRMAGTTATVPRALLQVGWSF